MIIPPLILDVATPELSADEQETVNRLQWRMSEAQPALTKREAYYDGEQPMRSLGIAIPPELQDRLRSAAGWPGIVVDTIDERLAIEGFRMGASADSDSELWDIWCLNHMERESRLAHLDALMYGRGFVMVGADDSGMPLITVESPVSMAATYDVSTQRVTAALQAYVFYGDEAAALYLPDETVHLVRPEGRAWTVRERDRHGLGRCPVVMLVNRARSRDRYGRSEITAELMSWTDMACRCLLRMEVAAEFFSAPQRYILGASETAFQEADGTPLDAWETYLGRVLALERDEEGNAPTVGTFAAADPTPHVSQLTALTKMVAGRTGVPQHLLGFSADNPASAEGILAAESALDRRAKSRQLALGPEWCEVQRLVLMLLNGGALPAEAARLEALWKPPETPTPLETSQAIVAQVGAGAIPATSDVTLSRLGYSAAERARLAADRQKAASALALQQIADSILGPDASAGAGAPAVGG